MTSKMYKTQRRWNPDVVAVLAAALMGISIAYGFAIDHAIEYFIEHKLHLPIPRELKLFPYKFPLIAWFSIFGLLILFPKLAAIKITAKKEFIMIVMIVVSLQFTALTGKRIEISDFVTIGSILFLLIYASLNTDYRFEMSTSSFLLLVILFFIFLASAVGGIGSLLSSSKFVKSILLFGLILSLFREKKAAYFFIKTLVMTTTVSAIIGIFQEIIYVLTRVPIIGFVDKHMKKLMWVDTSVGTLLRVPAFTGLHGVLAVYLTISITIATNLLLYGVLKDRKEKRLFFISIILMSTALILTFSNSALLATAAAVTLSICLRWSKFIIHFAVFVIGAFLVSYVTGFVDSFMNYVSKDLHLRGDLGLRMQLMREGITGLFHRHPLIGVGVGKGYRYTQNINKWPAHNSFLLVADEIGAFALCIFIFLFAILIVKQLGLIARLTSPEEKAIVKATLLGLVALVVDLQFHPSYLDNFIFLYIAMTEGIILVMQKSIYQPCVQENVRQLDRDFQS